VFFLNLIVFQFNLTAAVTLVTKRTGWRKPV